MFSKLHNNVVISSMAVVIGKITDVKYLSWNNVCPIRFRKSDCNIKQSAFRSPDCNIGMEKYIQPKFRRPVIADKEFKGAS